MRHISTVYSDYERMKSKLIKQSHRTEAETQTSVIPSLTKDTSYLQLRALDASRQDEAASNPEATTMYTLAGEYTLM